MKSKRFGCICELSRFSFLLEDGLRYKVEFKSGKEMVLPAYRVASLQPPILKDLFIGCRVVASSKDPEGKASFNAAVLVELPERKNRMR